MLKILLLIGIVFLVLAIIRTYQRSLRHSQSSRDESPVEDMVKCAHCSVNLPRSEAIFSGGDFFCSSEHQQRGKK